MRAVLMALAVAFSLAGQAVAGPYDAAVAAYREGDYATALRLIRPPADAGDPVAQNALGHLYEDGRGVPRDFAQALAWYRKAAGQGNAGGQNNLGNMYRLGRGVPQDNVMALMWYDLAAAGGSKIGARNRDRVAAMMIPGEIAEAQKLAREWKPKKP